MGVMACERSGCDNVCCRRLILNGEKYVCDSCWDELLLEKAQWPQEMPAHEVEDRIRAFMESGRGAKRLLSRVEVEREFERLTGEPLR